MPLSLSYLLLFVTLVAVCLELLAFTLRYVVLLKKRVLCALHWPSWCAVSHGSRVEQVLCTASSQCLLHPHTAGSPSNEGHVTTAFAWEPKMFSLCGIPTFLLGFLGIL